MNRRFARSFCSVPRVDAVLRPLWIERGKPEAGHVFISSRGKPYTGTRDLKVQGSNPLQIAQA